MATGCRPCELRVAKPEHIDLERKEWRLPETKNTTEHLIHLSDFTVEQFTILLEFSEHGWLLPAIKAGRHVSEGFLRKLIGERVSSVHHDRPTRYFGTLMLSTGPWTLHDLRRMMSSKMGDLGIDPHIIDACQNHKPKGMREVYQRREYVAKRRHAFNLWGCVGRQTSGFAAHSSMSERRHRALCTLTLTVLGNFPAFIRR